MNNKNKIVTLPKAESNSFFQAVVIDKNLPLVIARLSKKYNNPNLIDLNGRTPLMWSAFQFDKQTVLDLLKMGVEINYRDKNGNTALHFAAQEFSVGLAKLLLEKGAKVNSIDENGNSPLFRSLFSSQGRGNMIKLLLTAGADRNQKNKSGVSPYELAKQVTNYNLLKFFNS